MLPNGGVPLTVRLHEDNAITINSERTGAISDLQPLKRRLSEIFEERRKNGVFEEKSDKIEKGVGLKIPASARFEDAFSVAQSLKASGAEPIILLLDGLLPQQLITYTSPIKNGTRQKPINP